MLWVHLSMQTVSCTYICLHLARIIAHLPYTVIASLVCEGNQLMPAELGKVRCAYRAGEQVQGAAAPQPI